MISATALVSLLGSWAAGHLVGLACAQGVAAWNRSRDQRRRDNLLSWLDQQGLAAVPKQPAANPAPAPAAAPPVKSAASWQPK